jgi:hypothetical protein
LVYLGFNLLGLIVEGFEEEADLGGFALLVEEDADPLHLCGEVLAAGQREAHVVSQEHPTLRPGTRKAWNAVLGIRIRMFLDLLDPDPDPLVRGTDPNPVPDPSLFS